MKLFALLVAVISGNPALLAAAPETPPPAPAKHEVVVRLASQENLPGAVVCLVPADRTLPPSGKGQVTDAAGVASLEPLLLPAPSGPFEVRVALSGFVPVTLGPFVSIAALPAKLVVTLNFSYQGSVIVCTCP